MKKIVFLFIIPLLFLVSCIRPPVPDIEQTIQDANPESIIPLSNDFTEGYFQTTLPIQSSPTRGLIHSHIGSIGDGVSVGSRADIEQLERSMHRIATDFFDPDNHYFRDGLILQRDFVSNILNPADDNEDNFGLNPAIGTEINFDGTLLESGTDRVSQIRPLAYVLEQNFGTIVDDNFYLEGVTIALAINPHHTIIDTDRGLITSYQMTDDQILLIGQDMAAELLPLLRSEYDVLRDVPIILGLFILEAGNSVIPGRLASISVADVGSSSPGSWTEVDERHFLLENPPNLDIIEYDVNINDEFIFVREAIRNQFPHDNGIVGRVHFIDREVYRVSIVFNMHFFGYSEKLSFHQMVSQYVEEFSPEYDIRIEIRSTNEIHGAITRLPHSEPVITRISW